MWFAGVDWVHPENTPRNPQPASREPLQFKARRACGQWPVQPRPRSMNAAPCASARVPDRRRHHGSSHNRSSCIPKPHLVFMTATVERLEVSGAVQEEPKGWRRREQPVAIAAAVSARAAITATASR